MTTANKITILRILLVPFFIGEFLHYVARGNEWHRFGAVFIFGVVAMADGLDGYIARHYNQRSELGAILDPLADKILLVSSVILLGLNNGACFMRLPLWLVITIISRDVLQVIGFGVIHFTVGKSQVRPRWTGKCATVMQMATILWALLGWPPGMWKGMIVVTGVLTVISGALYLMDGVRQLNAHPASTAVSAPPKV